MTDEDTRAAERAYRASGSQQDGEAWVQAVLRTTGLPSTFLIYRVIEAQRALHALAGGWVMSGHSQEGLVQRALSMPVTPDDMVSFLRGDDVWRLPRSRYRNVTATPVCGAVAYPRSIDDCVLASGHDGNHWHGDGYFATTAQPI